MDTFLMFSLFVTINSQGKSVFLLSHKYRLGLDIVKFDDSLLFTTIKRFASSPTRKKLGHLNASILSGMIMSRPNSAFVKASIMENGSE